LKAFGAARVFPVSRPRRSSALWHGHLANAIALFSVEGSRIVVSDIFRDPNQPKGCAGHMLADAFAKVDASRPAIIRLGNILDTQPTSIDIQRGTAPKDTVLGRVTTTSQGAWRPRFPMTAWIGKGQAVDRS